ncbi:MAG: MFS transporter [bacterium]|nr:MFS transporter [bacterium]
MFSRLASHPLYIFSDYRQLFMGRLISTIGDKFFTIALAWWIISGDSENSKTELGILMAVTMLPVVLFGPLSGTFVDKFDKKKCMLISDFFRALFVFALATLMTLDYLSLPVLYAMVFAISSLIPLFDSSVNSSIVKLTNEENISRAVAADSMVVELSNIFGALLGSVLLALIDIEGALYFNGVTFLVSFFLIFRIKTKLHPEESGPGFLAEFTKGFTYLKKNWNVFSLLLVFAILNFFAAPLVLLIPMLVKFVVKESVSWVAVLELFLALGAGLTALYLSFKHQFRNIYVKIFLAIIIMGIALVLLSLLSNKFYMCPLFFVAGVSIAVVNALSIMLFQHVVPYEIKGRFFAILTTICFAVIPFAYLINGYLSDILSIPFIIAVNGVGTILLSFSILFIPKIAAHLGDAAEE